MANVNGAPMMGSEPGMMSQHSPKKEPSELKQENGGCKEEEEEDDERIDQLTLSQVIMNSAAESSVSPSMGTPRICGFTTRKRSKLMVKESCNKSPAYSPSLKEKANALQASLDQTHPSFVKLMLRSHVTQGFWLALPADFCRMYLTNYDLMITLEDENCMQYETKFLAGKGGLSGGWKRFSLAHNLQEGDIVVFHFVRQYAFKVYIVRANNLDCHVHERQLETAVNDADICQQMKNPVGQTQSLEENSQNGGHQETNYELGGERFSLESDKEDYSPVSFVDLKDFSVIVNGCPVDSEISFSARVKYYNLCCAKKSYLHDRLPKSINHKLAVGIILETVSIVDAIKACSLSTSQTDLEEWDKTLEGFMLLGMDVVFLLDRIRELLRLVVQYQDSDEGSRYVEVLAEENHLNEEIASLETKLAELKEAKINVQFEREALEDHLQNYDRTFRDSTKKLL